jgi:N-acetylglucosamine-6-phosphate deacetylase
MCNRDIETGFFPKNPVSRPILLINAHLYVPEPLGPGSVLVEGGKIVSIGEWPSGHPAPGVESIDLSGAALGPGLIDLHTHGADGVDLMDGDDAVVRMARFFARHGVTGFMPATVTASWEAIKQAVVNVRAAMAAPPRGARVLGIHLEGPFLSPERLGAQSHVHCIPPTPESVARLIGLARGLPVTVTLAPELKGGMDAIHALVGAGAVVSIGHTVASTEEAEAAFSAGATQVTHLFNGMPPMHHRMPGVVGAALTTDGVRVELIADGVHLHPTTVRLAIAAKGVDGVILVTDSMAATGCADGKYVLGPVKVVVVDGTARLESGALAGSTVTLDRMVVDVARWTDAPWGSAGSTEPAGQGLIASSGRSLGAAWQMASLNSARQLGLDDHLGRIAPGYDADLTAMDASGRVVLTVVGGEIVYRA